MIRIADHGRVRVLTLARGQKRNAIDTALAEALIAALRAADAAESVAALVLAGEGAVFCAGADLAELRALAADPVAREARVTLSAALLAAPGACGKPVVAAVQGAAMGAGAALALGCDQVLLAGDARLGFPEAQHGILPERMVPVLRRHLPPRRAFDLLATGRALPATEALAWGLADAVVPAASLLQDAIARAELCAQLPPAQTRRLKQLCGTGTAA